MLNPRQQVDSDLCEKEERECFGCSCSICIAQEPTDYKSGLTRAIEVLDAGGLNKETLEKVKEILERERARLRGV